MQIFKESVIILCSEGRNGAIGYTGLCMACGDAVR
jgi:hypothetical protein